MAGGRNPADRGRTRTRYCIFIMIPSIARHIAVRPSGCESDWDYDRAPTDVVGRLNTRSVREGDPRRDVHVLSVFIP